jgi:hypothetical protein
MIGAGLRMTVAWPFAVMEMTMQEKTTSSQPVYRRTWVAVLAAVALLFLLVLVVLPYGISYGLHQWLLANGGEDVQLEDVDFNVFTGRATVTDLNVTADGQVRLVIPRLELDVDWMPLFSKHVAAKAIVFDGVKITIIQAPDGSMRIGGISLPATEGTTDEAAGEPWGLGLEELEIINTSITYQSPDLQLVTHLERLRLSHLVTWTTDPAQLVLNGTVNDAPVMLDGQLPPLSDGFGYTGKLDITSLRLHAFATLAESALTGLGGQLSLDSELDVLLTPGESLTVSHSGLFGLDGLTLEQEGRQINYAGLQWQGEMKLASAVDSGGLDLELQGTITGKDLGVADNDFQLSYAGLQWQGEMKLASAVDNGGLDLDLQGTITGKDLGVADNDFQLSYAGLQWQGEMKLASAVDNGGLDLDLQGTINGNDLGVAGDDYQLSYAGQQWTGALSLNAAAGKGSTDIKLQGTVTGDDLAVLVPAEDLSVYHGKFLWEGAVAVEAGEETAVAAEGRLQLGKLGADIADKNANLVSINDLTIEKLNLHDDGGVTVTGLNITDAVFAKNPEEKASKKGREGSVLSAGLITADSIQVTADNQVAIGVLEWRDVISLIQRAPDGVWRPVRIVDTLPFANRDAEAPQPAAESGTDAPAGRVRVDEISITGDSAIILEDATVKPPFNLRLTVTEAILKNVDSGQPDLNSPLSIKGRISKHSNISIKGTQQLFAESPTLDLTNHVDGISLPQLTPYTVEALGYALESGHLDADSTLKINRGKIDNQNHLVIRGLKITPVDNEGREKLDSQLTVSLDTALGMLRDKNDTIKLDLPVSGDIDSPDFDISDIINTAVSKAITQGSMTYLKLALQPYGSLITVAQMAGEAAMKVRLQPVGFEPGLVKSVGEAGSYLKKVAGIMKDRPEVNIKICGLAVAADRIALAGGTAPKEADSKTADSIKGGKPVTDQQLLDLAKQRAGFVKDELVTKYGVTASRLVACTPHIDDAEDDDIMPRVDLLI